MEPEPISIATTAAGSGVVFSREERERHVYIVGKSGSGKSTFLFNLAMGDITAGEGVAVIDPHTVAIANDNDFDIDERGMDADGNNPAKPVPPPHVIQDILELAPHGDRADRQLDDAGRDHVRVARLCRDSELGSNSDLVRAQR